MANLVDWIMSQVDKIERQSEDEMVEAASEGYEAWKSGIETEGTGNGIWHEGWWKENPFRNESPYNGEGSDGSHSGRVHTGKMRDSVTFRRGDKSAELGFISNFEDYFKHQEVGFYNAEAGVTVEGMGVQAQVHSVIDDSLVGNGWEKE